MSLAQSVKQNSSRSNLGPIISKTIDMNNLISQYLTWHDIYNKSSMENNSLQNLTLDKNIFLPNIKSTTKMPTSSDDTQHFIDS